LHSLDNMTSSGRKCDVTMGYRQVKHAKCASGADWCCTLEATHFGPTWRWFGLFLPRPRRQWKTNISSQRQRHTGSVFSQPHELKERPQFSRPCYTPEVRFNMQDSIDAIGEATLLEYRMGPISKSRLPSKLLLPASDIMWDENVDMTSS
jgi:hypothetical protein